jgi:membrane-associated phospholipid phosphatase
MPTPQSIDLGALFFFRGFLTHDVVSATADFLTHLGDRWFLGIVAAAAAVGFVAVRQGRTGLYVVLTLLVAIGLTIGVKYTVRRPRPFEATLPYKQIDGYSFPSGHALESAALYGGLAAVLARRLRGRRWSGLVGMLGILLPFLVGFTRLLLCYHYVTDVLGGWCAGAALAMLCAGIDVATQPAPQRADDLAVAAPSWRPPPSEGVMESEDRLQS